MTTERRPGRHAGAPAPWIRRPSGWRGVSALLFTGAIAILLGLAGASSVQGLRNSGVTTSAEVVDVTTRRGGDTYALRLAVEGGGVVTCETGDVLGRPTKGDTLHVLYDREAPDMNCQGAEYGTDLTAPVIFVVAGAFLLLIGAVGLRPR